MKKPKSSTVAGFLGVFTGWAGGHDWYLGRKQRALIHVALSGLALILAIIGTIIYSSTSSYLRLLGVVPTGTIVLSIIAGLLFYTSAIWGVVDGIMLLAKGNAGLEAVGVKTVSQAPTVERKPVDPKLKKKIIAIIIAVLGGLLLIGIIVLVIVMLTRVDYGETYREAKITYAHARELYDNSACEDVVDRVYLSSVTEKTYNGYIDSCRKLVESDSDTVEKLGQTSGIRKNKELSAKYDEFKAAYDAALPNKDDLGKALDLYQAWHKFSLAIDKLKDNSPKKDITAAADILKQTGNSTAKEFAEDWEKSYLAYLDASEAYRKVKGQEGEDDAYKAMRSAWDDLEDVLDEAPDDDEIANLDFSGTSKMFRSFKNLYSSITSTYEDNYDYNSKDCYVYSDKSVSCD